MDWDTWLYETLAEYFRMGAATLVDEEEGEGVWAYLITFKGNLYWIVG
jgi:hypothetical protein